MHKNNNGILKLLGDYMQINVHLIWPTVIPACNYRLWTEILIKKPSLENIEKQIGALKKISKEQQIFIETLIKIYELLLELANVPVFFNISIISGDEDKSTLNRYLLNLEVPLINYIPELVYRLLMNAAVDLCQWMAFNSPSAEHCSEIYSTISESIVKPISQFVPGGESTLPVLNFAHAQGIPMTHLGSGVYQLGWGSKARRIYHSITDRDSSIGQRLSCNKVSTASLLKTGGIPAPVHAIARTEQQAVLEAINIGFPVVAKPVNLDRGEGVSVDIFTIESLCEAFRLAQKVSGVKEVIIERQVPGICHRVFIANGCLLCAYKRLPMSVIGDGVRTVEQLVNYEVSEQERLPPWRRTRKKLKKIDALALSSLAASSLSPDSIPAAGQFVPLRRNESTEHGGVFEDVTEKIHPDNIKIALDAVKLLGLNIAGVDIMSVDISTPWHENFAIINEVNFAPSFGGGPITRSYIPKLLAGFINDGGKIPIEIIDIENDALARHEKLCVEGLRCYFVGPEKCVDFKGNLVFMSCKGVKLQLRALVCNADVDAIVVYTSDQIA